MQAALSMGGQEFDGRRLRVERASFFLCSRGRSLRLAKETDEHDRREEIRVPSATERRAEKIHGDTRFPARRRRPIDI